MNRKQYTINNNEKIKESNKLYREKNKKLLKQKAKEYYKNNPMKYYKENRETILNNRKLKYLTDKEYKKLILKQHNEYRIKNKEKIFETQKIWTQKNKMLSNSYKNKNNRKRRALKLMINECYSFEDEKYTRELFNNCCVNCGKNINLCIDHHYPLNKGNPLTKQNAVLLCRNCNSSKGDSLPEIFYTKEKLKYIEQLLLI